jgi:hypothetical protein
MTATGESDFKRGDVVLCVLSGDYGGGAIIIQSDLFNPTHASFTLTLKRQNHKIWPGYV